MVSCTSANFTVFTLFTFFTVCLSFFLLFSFFCHSGVLWPFPIKSTKGLGRRFVDHFLPLLIFEYRFLLFENRDVMKRYTNNKKRYTKSADVKNDQQNDDLIPL